MESEERNMDEPIMTEREGQIYSSDLTDSAYLEDSSPTAFTAGLYKQLIGINRQKSHFYNTLLLACFNMNLAHYSFPYLASCVGLPLMVVFIIVSLLISNIAQKFLMRFLTDFKSECNYGKVVELTLGSFVAYIIEIMALIWYISLMIVASKAVEETAIAFIDTGVVNDNRMTIKAIVLGVLLVLLLLVNMFDKYYVIDIYVFICMLIQIVSIIVQFVEMIHFIKINETINLTKVYDPYRMFDILNLTAIGSNTIILSFWVHSKYQTKSSKDSSSSIVNISSVIVLVFYLIDIIIVSISFPNPSTVYRFNLYRDSTEKNYITNDGIINIDKAYLVLNSVCFLFMLNFYFKCIKEVVLRKHLVMYFQGKWYFISFGFLLLIALVFSFFFSTTPYFIILTVNSTIGVFMNYMIPIFLWIKYSNENLTSAKTIGFVLSIYILYVSSLASSYLNLTDFYGWNLSS